MKVALIIGTAGRCKRDELTYLLLDDVKDEGNFFRICLRNTNRDFIILGETINGINLVDIIRRYINLRPPLADIQRFFIAYRNGKCVNQPVGVHTIGGIPKKVATFLGLPNPEAFIGFRSKNTSQSGWPSTNFTEGFNEYF
ncbi:hypothetical protein JTB14_033067 [Gonioctena quinquepunctata]|nr:hypothetical protein JTB14_033067 [Gonioctena quinquepunctata]